MCEYIYRWEALQSRLKSVQDRRETRLELQRKHAAAEQYLIEDETKVVSTRFLS
jgi:hypothetical protein